ncbi:MAG: PAS domain S-box protein [Chloroflexi bacterium]|nr:PAS domain S-box protein [Chloroflexota bacterium]MDL1883182.1 PAS domain S-box protein [Anaerolineae bacterium CFX8]
MAEPLLTIMGVTIHMKFDRLPSQVSKKQRCFEDAESLSQIGDQCVRIPSANVYECTTFINADGIILYAGDSTAAITGYDGEKLIGRSFFDLLPPEDVGAFHHELQNLTQTAYGSAIIRYRFHHQDGSWRWMEAVAAKLAAGTDTIALNFRDITQHKNTEDVLLKLNQAYRMLSDCNQALMRATDEYDLLQQVCQIIVAVGDYHFAWVGLNEPDGLNPVAQAGIHLADIQPADRPLIETARHTGQVHINRQLSPDGDETPPLNRRHSSAILPIQRNHQILGILYVNTPEADAFGETEIELLQELADNLGYGLTALRTQAEHRRVQSALIESQKFLEQAQEISRIGSWVADRDGSINWSKQIYNIFGLDETDFDGSWDTFLSLVHPDDRETVRAASRNALVLGLPYAIEHRILHANGGLRFVRQQADVIRDESGQPLRLIGVIRDITEHKQTEQELTALYNATSYLFKSDNLLNLGHQIVQAVIKEFGQADCSLMLVDKHHRTILRLARAGTYRADPLPELYLDGPGLVPQAIRTGQIIYAPDVTASPHYAASIPTTRSELAVPLNSGKEILGVLDLQSPQPDAYSLSQRRVIAAFAERAASAVENMLLYEEVNHYAGELEMRVSQRTAELHRAKERIETIFNNSSDAIILAHEQGAIQQTNQAFFDLLGYTTDEVFGHSIGELTHPDDISKLTQALETVVLTGQAERLEIQFRRKDGSLFEADLALAPVQNEENYTISLVCSLRDITQRKRVEAELRRALEREKELSELKTRFVSMVSHEFRTPLTAIQSSSDLLKRYLSTPNIQKQNDHLAKIQVQIKRLTQLLDEVLTLSKAQSIGLQPNLTSLDFELLCREITADMQAIAGNRTIILNADPLPAVTADPKLLRQAITNLLSNAIKYSPDGSPIEMNVHAEGDNIIVQIRDYGIGIPEKDQQHLFEVFHRATNVGTIPGTGIGLAIVKQSVEAHHGDITFESRVGEGTTFTLTIPRTQPMESDT